jgi:Uma2 family endonuclease
MTATEIPTLTQRTKYPEQFPSGAVVLREISWDVYESLLAQLDRSGQRMYLTYDRGTLEIMPPSPFHERSKTILGRLIETMSTELEIPIAGLGSTTFRREDLERGLEPDECYYVQHEAMMRAKFSIDLTQDPPPDLAFEMDYTHHPIDRISVYAALGVPEIWIYDGDRLNGLRREPDGRYSSIHLSIAFPFLRLSDLEGFLTAARSTGEYAAVIAFRDWLRQTHGKRV